LPRKFNIAFDGGGLAVSLEETNDIGFRAVKVEEASADEQLPAGLYFSMALGGITGHGDFARPTGVLVRPEDCVPVAVAVLRVFIQHGDRTDRKKARLKYLLDRWGVAKFLEAAEDKFGEPFRRLPLGDCEPRRAPRPHGWIGFHPQRHEGYRYLGVVVPVGRLQAEQMRGLAGVAARYGEGDLRLTVWQNLLIPHLREADCEAVAAEIRELGLETQASSVMGGLVACTGNTGCKFAASNTKGHALMIAHQLNQKLDLPEPINIHLTGCPHSCAQHYCGDIGLLGVKTKRADGEAVEGYNVVLGGGVDDRQGIAREFLKGVPADELTPKLEAVLQHYLAHRWEEEAFVDFVRRSDLEELKQIVEAENGS